MDAKQGLTNQNEKKKKMQQCQRPVQFDLIKGKVEPSPAADQGHFVPWTAPEENNTNSNNLVVRSPSLFY